MTYDTKGASGHLALSTPPTWRWYSIMAEAAQSQVESSWSEERWNCVTESAVCWSRPLLHPDTAGLDSTPIAEGKWMGGWTTVSFFNPDIQSELQTGIPLRPQRLPTSPQFLSSHQLLPTRKPSRPWCQSQCSSYSIVTQWPRRPRVTAKFYLWPPKCKADNRTCSFSVCCHDSSGGNSARPGFWPKTEQNKRKRPLFWSQLEILTKAKPMTGRSLRRRCLHPVGGIKSIWGASPVAVSLSVCHGFCLCWRYTRDEASQPHFSQQNIIFFP